MKKYQVLESGKLADETGYPILKGFGWKNATFDSFEKAVEYAKKYFYPIYPADMDNLIPNKSYSSSFEPDFLRIQEVEI
jgi:hypothetical protein